MIVDPKSCSVCHYCGGFHVRSYTCGALPVDRPPAGAGSRVIGPPLTPVQMARARLLVARANSPRPALADFAGQVLDEHGLDIDDPGVAELLAELAEPTMRELIAEVQNGMSSSDEPLPF